jgi:hypothetical protein
MSHVPILRPLKPSRIMGYSGAAQSGLNLPTWIKTQNPYCLTAFNFLCDTFCKAPHTYSIDPKCDLKIHKFFKIDICAVAPAMRRHLWLFRCFDLLNALGIGQDRHRRGNHRHAGDKHHSPQRGGRAGIF